MKILIVLNPTKSTKLLRNAELRDELERYFDESISRVNVQHLTLAAENEFLASMLAWEQAPVLPIYRWFEPELRLPRPEALSDARSARHPLGRHPEALPEADRPGFHRSPQRPRTLLPDLPRHPPGAGEEARPPEQLSPLGLHRPQRRSGGVAPLLCQRRGAGGLGRVLSPAAAAARAAAVSAHAAPRAGRSLNRESGFHGLRLGSRFDPAFLERLRLACPNGAAVLPAPANGRGIEAARPHRRPNGPTLNLDCGELLARWAKGHAMVLPHFPGLRPGLGELLPRWGT